MKNILFLAVIGLLTVNNVFGQAAGNWIVNQKKSVSYGNTDLYYNTNVSGGYTQQLASPTYNYTTVNDTILEIKTNVLMNVKADTYVAIFGLSQTGENIELCQQLINSRINDFVKSMKYDPNLNLHDYADNLYNDVGEVASTLIRLRYSQAENSIKKLLQNNN